MKNTTLILGALFALVAGSVGGYSFGKSANSNEAQDKELQDSIAMMKEQSASIQTMAVMMKSAGIAMQEMGIKYKNNEAISGGKDLEMIGLKYMSESSAAVNSESMSDMMGN